MVYKYILPFLDGGVGVGWCSRQMYWPTLRSGAISSSLTSRAMVGVGENLAESQASSASPAPYPPTLESCVCPGLTGLQPVGTMGSPPTTSASITTLSGLCYYGEVDGLGGRGRLNGCPMLESPPLAVFNRGSCVPSGMVEQTFVFFGRHRSPPLYRVHKGRRYFKIFSYAFCVNPFIFIK